MSDKKCYICDKPLDNEKSFVINDDDELFDLCEQHYKTTQRLFKHIDKRREELKDKICCKNYDKNCEYNGTWFCKNPDCKTPVITSTLPGAYPSGCPKIDKWNSRSVVISKIHSKNAAVYYWCSECMKEEEKTSDFCPNCGADMREKEGE